MFALDMTPPAERFTHEQLVMRRGTRSGFPIVIAIHSSVLGQPIGGCRLRHYVHWQDGVADALHLAESMTHKCAIAGLDHGGAKSVIVTPESGPPSPDQRRAALLDVGDLVESLGGRYATGPDIGTGPVDMLTIAERTRHVFCLPAEHGGSGDSAPATARGTYRAIQAACAHRFGSADLHGRTATVIGLGAVGTQIARILADAGARLTVADIDPARKDLPHRPTATWLTPDQALHAPADILVPAAVGGLLTPAVVPGLRCAVIAGPANNQLSTDAVADLLHARDILWIPDYVASAGGVINATAVDRDGRSHTAALAEVDRVGPIVTHLLDTATQTGVTPHLAARRLVQARLSAG